MNSGQVSALELLDFSATFDLLCAIDFGQVSALELVDLSAAFDLVCAPMDSGQVSALELLDLSATFDTAGHYILMDVFSSQFTVAVQVHEWFRSYLSGRIQTLSTLAGTSDGVALV